jgi:mannitol 2-dehydrogenase
VPGIDLARYRADLLSRFGNPAVRDSLARLCAFSSDRIPGFVLPVLRDQLPRGSSASISRAALVCAAWARYAAGLSDRGKPITVVDRLLDVVVTAAHAAQRSPAAFLHETGVFGDLADDPRFVDAFASQLRALQEHGALGAVRRVLGGGAP